MTVRVLTGDCRDVLRTLPDASVDSVVTDPPYGWTFMGRKWDYDVPSVELWSEVLRVLKPGGHLLCFCGTRTQHRMAVNIEDAGFEIRDMLAWVYGSGFPKSLDVSKAIDKAAGAEREVVGRNPNARDSGADRANGWNRPWQAREDAKAKQITAPATDAARQWQGWGTALKPSLEPVTLARKPLAEKTVAGQVLATGTGALNVDGCRIETGENLNGGRYSDNKKGDDGAAYGSGINRRSSNEYQQPAGRWPSNLLHDGSEEVVGLFPVTKARGNRDKSSARGAMKEDVYAGGWGAKACGAECNYDEVGSQGSAARFFYCAKASKRDRGEGNNHPTVKPTDLMRWLVRLVTPPGGTVLDPFAGSGTTGIAAQREGFNAILIERDEAYVEIARNRLTKDGGLFMEVAAE